jgi:hypothetical protein
MPVRLAVLLAGLCGLLGCTLTADEDLLGTFDDVPPRVLEVFPPDGWEEVPTGVEVRIWFSEPVEPTSVHRGSITLISGEDLAEGSFEVSEDGLVVFTPLQALISGVAYRLVVTSWVTDLYGNPLESGVETGFSTLR